MEDKESTTNIEIMEQFDEICKNILQARNIIIMIGPT